MKRLFKRRRFLLGASLTAGILLLVAICLWYRAENANPASASDLNALIEERGSITFRSWDGIWIGTDCDTEITFLPDQVVYLIEYEDAVSCYKGTYAINQTGRIAIRLDDLDKKWPIMVLERDTLSLRLRPKKRSLSFTQSGKSDATIWDGDNSYWPFRPVTADAEKLLQKERWRWCDR